MSKNTLLSNLINYISANSSGNVVIAEPTSGFALDVTGTGRFTGALSGTSATFSSNTGIIVGANSRAFIRQTTGGDAEIGAPSGGTLSLFNNGSSALSFGATGAATFSSSVTIEGNNSTIRSGNELRFNRADNAIYTRLYDGGGANGFVIDNRNGDGFNFQSAGTSQFRIAGTGAATFSSSVTATSVALNGSIANSGDAATLTIKQTSTSYNNGIYLERGGERNGYHMYIGGAVDSLTFRRNYFGTQGDVMSLTRDGNVGIGTTSPTNLLTIANNSAGTNGIDFQNYASAQVLGKIYYEQTNDTFRFVNRSTYSTGGIVFITGGDTSERMRITSGGNVGIGTDSIPYGNVAIKSNSTTTYHGLNVFANGNNNFIALNHTGSVGVIETEFSTSGGHTPMSFRTNGAERMQITTGGQIFLYNLSSGAGTNAARYSTATGQLTYDTSSARYKDNIRDSVYGLSDVLKMRSAMFEYKEDNRTDVGLIAEELYTIIPELVGIDKSGRPDSVSYDRLVSVLIKSVQELKAELDTANSRLQLLENK